MATRLVLFDVDGTLIDTAGAGRRALERACSELFGIEHIPRRAADVRFAGQTDPVIFASVAEVLGIDGARFEREKPRLIRLFLRALADEMSCPHPRRRVLPGVRPLLEHLRARGDVHLGLVTGNLEEGARVKLEPFGLNAFFPAGGFASDHHDRGEIARTAWRRACDLTGITFSAGEVCVVGDTEHDVSCARVNGFRAVAVESGWVPRESLERARPDALLSDLSDQEAALVALDLGRGTAAALPRT